MGHTDGGPAKNLLYNWTASAIVISVDLDVVAKGGALLAVWGTTSIAGKPLDRMGLPFVKTPCSGAVPFRPTMRVACGASNSMRRAQRLRPGSLQTFRRCWRYKMHWTGNAGTNCSPDQKSRRRAIGHSPNCSRRIDFGSIARRVSARSFSPLNSEAQRSQGVWSRLRRPLATYDTANIWRSL